MIKLAFRGAGEGTLLGKEPQGPLPRALEAEPGKPWQTFLTGVSTDQSSSAKGRHGNVFPTADCLSSYLDHPFLVIFFSLATSGKS